MSHIFVSYSHKDEEAATALVIRLQTAGFAVWQDAIALRPSENWKTGIQRGVNEASAFIVLWSEHSSDSEWVGKEVVMALEEHDTRDLPIYQLRLDETALDEKLSDFHALDFVGYSSTQIDKLMASLPVSIQWRVSEFDVSKTLEEQGATPAPDISDLVRFKLLQSGSGRCSAYIVGQPKDKREDKTNLQVALRFTLPENLPVLSQVVDTVRYCPDEELPKVDFYGLYITGPLDKVSGRYWMDNNDPAIWLESVYTIHKAIDLLIAGRSFTNIDIYSAAPQALVMGLTLRMFKHYPVTLYNNIMRKTPPFYQAVLNSRILLGN